MGKHTKLELTWIGKDDRPRLEPRILIEDPQKSYHAPHRVSKNDIFDNILIYGDNLLALKALEQEFTGKIRCIFIDPPYNTGAAFDHYDDGVEHSMWLSLMRDRLEILKHPVKIALQSVLRTIIFFFMPRQGLNNGRMFATLYLLTRQGILTPTMTPVGSGALFRSAHKAIGLIKCIKYRRRQEE